MTYTASTATVTAYEAFINGFTEGALIWQEIERSAREALPYWVSGYKRLRFAVAVVVVLLEMAAAAVDKDVERCLQPQEALSSFVQVQSTAELSTETTAPIFETGVDFLGFPLESTPIEVMTDFDYVVMAKQKRYPKASKWAYSKVLSDDLKAAIVAYEGL